MRQAEGAERAEGERRQGTAHTALLLAALLPLACESDERADAGVQYEEPQILPDNDPLCVSYQDVRVGQVRTQNVLLRNDGRKQLRIAGGELLEDARGYLRVGGLEPSVVETRESAALQIVYEPLAPGWDTATLRITSNAQNYPTLRIFVLARAAPEGLDAGTAWDAGEKPEKARDGGEACPDEFAPR